MPSGEGDFQRDLLREVAQRRADRVSDADLQRGIQRKARRRTTLSLSILALALVATLSVRLPSPENSEGRGAAVKSSTSPTPIRLSNLRRIAHLPIALERDVQTIASARELLGADSPAVAEAERRLSLRQLVARDGDGAAPALFDAIEQSSSAAIRADAAVLLSVIGHRDAGEEIYYEIVRVIDQREASLRELLTATTHILKTLRGKPAPRWAVDLGGELQSFVLNDADAREPALRLLFELQRVTGVSYSATGLSVLRSGIEGPGTQSAMMLLSDEEILLRREELMAVCQRLFGGDSRAAALRFLQKAHRLADYSALAADVALIASSSQHPFTDRRAAAAALARFEGVHPNEVYARFRLLEEK